MGYLGRSPAVGTQRLLDNIESQFNGTLVTFDLRYGTAPTYPTLSASLIVSLGGVLQEPGAAYYVSSDKIVFSEAPLAGTECWILLYSQYGTGVGSAQQGNLGAENLTLTGELRGPSTFVIDPASVGDDTGLVRIKGGLEVLGTTTTISSTTLTVADKNIVIGQGGSTLSSIDTAGIDFGSTAVRLRYNYNGGTASGLSIEGGNVGIGTTSPGNLLHLSTAGASYLQIQNTTAANSIYFGNSSGNGIIQVDGANSLNISINGSQRASIDSSGNVGVGVTTPSVFSVGKAIEIGHAGNALFGATSGQFNLMQNVNYNANFKYVNTAAASYYQQLSGAHIWYTAVSGTAGTTATFSERLRITNAGLVGLGTNGPSVKLEVRDSIAGGSDGTIATLHNFSDTGADTRYSGLNFRIGSDNGTSAIRAFRTAGAIDYRTDLSFWTNPTGATQTPVRAMTIDHLQRVGIGTTGPTQQLEVYGTGMKVNNASYVGYLGAGNTFASGAASDFCVRADNVLSFAAGGPYERARIRSDGTFEIKGAGTAGSSPAVSVNPSAPADSAVIDSSGRLGLGISNPGARLVVFGSGNIVRLGDGTNTFDVRFQGPNNWAVQLDTSADKFNIQRNSISLVTVTSGGLVGIGTTTGPTIPLQVLNAGTGNNTNNGAINLCRTTTVGSTLYHTYSTAVSDEAFAFSVHGGTTFSNTTYTKYLASAGGVHVWYGATNATESMRISSGGLVGIGNSDPQSQLSILGPVGTLNDGNGTLLVATAAVGTDVGGTRGAGITFAQKWASTGVPVRTAGIYGVKEAGTGNFGGGLAIYTQTNNSGADMLERVRIANSGAVGIGTIAPLGKFAVGNSSNNSLVSIDSSASYAEIQSYNAPLYINRQGNHTIFNTGGGHVGVGTTDPYSKVHIAVSSSSTALLLNNSAGGGGAYVDLDFATYSIIGLAGYANAPATIRVIDDGFYSGHITFRTKTSGTPGGASTEKMRLDASGNLGVGVVPSSTAANAAKLHVYSSSSNAAVIEQTSNYYHVMRGKIVQSVSNATAVPLFTAGGMYSCGLMVEVICRGTQALGASMWKDTITAWRHQTVGTYQNSGVNAATQLLVAGTHTSGTLSWTNVSTANPTLNYTQGANGYILESIDVYVTARDGASITFNTSFQSFG